MNRGHCGHSISTTKRLLVALALVALGIACASSGDLGSAGSWIEVRGPYFRIISDGDRDQTLELARELEIYRRVLLHLGIARPSLNETPFKILASSDRWTYTQFTGRHETIGWFVPTLRGSFATAALGARYKAREVGRGAFFHEYTHHVMSQNYGFKYPHWYEEGFAEYLSGFEVDEQGGISLGLPVGNRIPQLGGFVRWPDSLEFLFEDRGQSYPLAWVTTHYLLSHPTRSQQLMGYLTLYDRGAELDDAYRAAFDVSYRDLQREVHAYYRKGEYPYRYVEPGTLGAIEPFDTRSLSASEARSEVAEVFLQGNSSQHAKAVRMLEKALDLDPTNAQAVAELAALRLAAGDLEAAEALLSRARDRDSERLATVRGNFKLARAEQQRQAGDPDWEDARNEARIHFSRALQLDSRVPEPYRGIGLTYLLDDPGSEEGLDWLEKAQSRQPLEMSIQLDMAGVRMERGEVEGIEPFLDYAIEHASDAALRARARHLQRDLAESRIGGATSSD